jgi:hypothetical protein
VRLARAIEAPATRLKQPRSSPFLKKGWEDMMSIDHSNKFTARAAFLTALAIAALALPQSLAAGTISIPFNAANFSQPLTIDNPFLPMVPGTTQIYRATGVDVCEEVRVTVTNKTKTIAGVTARVVTDLAYEDEGCDGGLVKVEDTLDWFAQDNAGNVWYMGENTKDCVGNRCTPGAGSWQAGVGGAVAGIAMLAHPQSGDEYYQEFLRNVAEDQARVTGLDVAVLLTRADAYPPGQFTGCLKTKEWSALATGSVEQKYYCPGIGLVAVDEHHGKNFRSELVDPAADALRFRTP